MDLIFYNGEIRTMDPKNPVVQAVAVDGGKIVKAGSDVDVLMLKDENTKLIDLNSRLMIPGFNDSHMHLFSHASTLSQVNLTGTASAVEIVEKIKTFIADNNVPEGQPVIGYGWNQNFFNIKAYPTRRDLDLASVKHPIVITRACHHVDAVNTYTLDMFNINRDTKDLSDGEILRESDGFPNGVFTENARRLIGFETTPDYEDWKKTVEKALPYFAQMGITSVQSDDFTIETPAEMVYDIYNDLVKENRLTVRINQQCRSFSVDGYREMIKMDQTDN
ncbi:MAG: amidohydrolase family protein, partial [Clostridiales bacterium]|nr:amidohydrolase family protein [Clostridiales bacterium]